MSARVASAMALETLHRLRSRGVHLSLKDGELCYKAPKGTLTAEDLYSLKVARTELADILRLQQAAIDTESLPLTPRASKDPAALSYAQRAHWRKYELATRPHVRQIASASRLLGPLNASLLRESWAAVERRHEALRTRILVLDGVPHQQVQAPTGIELRTEDLRGVTRGLREVVIRRALEQEILEPICVTSDPLVAVRLLQLAPDEHVLILTMEHLISDGYSRTTVLEDLFATYEALNAGVEPSRPDVPIQFVDFALWQRANESRWLNAHRAYWDERLAGCERLEFPEDRVLGADAPRGWGHVPIVISPELKHALLRWCHARGLTLALTVFAAYCAAVLRWCDAREGVIKYEINGRAHPELEYTVGYFASGLNLRIQIETSETLEDLARRVTAEYCNAYEHADHAFLDTEAGSHELARSTAFNWQPAGQRALRAGAGGADASIKRAQLSFAHPMMKTLEYDAEPAVALFDTDDAVEGRLYFPHARFSGATMSRFAASVLVCVEALARHPSTRLRELRLPSAP